MSRQIAIKRRLKEISMVKRRCMKPLNKKTFKFRDVNERVEEHELDSGRWLLKTYRLSQWVNFLERSIYSEKRRSTRHVFACDV